MLTRGVRVVNMRLRTINRTINSKCMNKPGETTTYGQYLDHHQQLVPRPQTDLVLAMVTI
jgi:hypothetical protein